jgi:integrase
MPRRRGLNDQQVATLPRKAKRYNYPDPTQGGLYLRVSPDKRTPISYAAVARDGNGKQIWATLGTTEAFGIERARNLAREAIRRIKAGQPTVDPDKPTVKAVAEDWIRLCVNSKRLRTRDALERIIGVHIVPQIGSRIFVDLKRSDIAKLLDIIQDSSGPQTADKVLMVLRSIGRWVQSRDDDYVAPFVAGMTRTAKEDRERSRVLGDDEIRAIWKTAAANGAYGAAVRLLLLTAQRRDKVATMQWSDVSEDGVWTIRTEPREKGNAGSLQLPKLALEILATLPRFVGNPHVFAGNGSDAFSMLHHGKYKAALDLKCGVSGWVLHDLRRTARSLMSRAGVQAEHAERVLGHAIEGVEGIYNRHSYDAEKANALRKLAELIERIVNLPTS